MGAVVPIFGLVAGTQAAATSGPQSESTSPEEKPKDKTSGFWLPQHKEVCVFLLHFFVCLVTYLQERTRTRSQKQPNRACKKRFSMSCASELSSPWFEALVGTISALKPLDSMYSFKRDDHHRMLKEHSMQHTARMSPCYRDRFVAECIQLYNQTPDLYARALLGGDM
jgi:hypothetical protein